MVSTEVWFVFCFFKHCATTPLTSHIPAPWASTFGLTVSEYEQKYSANHV